MTRLIWIAAGWLALALGGVGVVLPLLPTTPFVILAAFLFGKGSPRLQAWLESHRTFGPAIRDWSERGAIARRHKTAACAAMALAIVGSALAGLRAELLLVQALCMAAAAAFILTRPGKSRAPRS